MRGEVEGGVLINELKEASLYPRKGFTGCLWIH